MRGGAVIGNVERFDSNRCKAEVDTGRAPKLERHASVKARVVPRRAIGPNRSKSLSIDVVSMACPRDTCGMDDKANLPPSPTAAVPSLQPTHERVTKLHGAYTAFIAAGIVSFISGDPHITTQGWVICLWCLSLPWLVTLLLLDYIVRERQKRESSASRGFATLLGYGLSNLGTAALIGFYSWTAAAIFLVSLPVCALYLNEVAGLGGRKGFEQL